MYSPLKLIAFSNSPWAVGEAIWSHTLEAPAELPMMVMLAGSPPNADMFCLHPVHRKLLVLQTEVSGVSTERLVSEEAEHAQPILDANDDHRPSGGQFLFGIGGCRAAREPAAVNVDDDWQR